MLAPILAVLSLAAGCGFWVIFQRWVARRDPGQPGIEGHCSTCGTATCTPEDKRTPIR